MRTVSQDLVEWAWALGSANIALEARSAVCDHILDGLGNAIAASRLRTAPQAEAVAQRLGGPEEASIIGGRRTGAGSAALANGILIHALDFDDTHPEALVHPTAVVFPAALAIGEKERATGEGVLTAAVAGYEVVVRLGAGSRHGFHRHGFHATSVCGVFSSALVAARLMKLSEAQAVSALGIAGSFAAGSLEFLSDGSDTKQLHPGWASHAGIVAAYLAADGASGPATIIEGEAGLFRLYAGSGLEPASITSDLGSTWHLTETMIKPYPACQLSHASFDALKLVRQRLENLSVIDRITFDVPRESVPIICEPAAAKLRPRSTYEAKFSLQWCAAALLVDGALGVETFAPANLARPEILDLAARIHYRAYDPGVAAASAPGRVVVEANGRTERVETPAGRGAISGGIDEKFALNVGASAAADELNGLVRNLDKLPGMDHLTSLLRRVPQRVAT
jgi:2-methylcitrate dehydratase PrpD